MGVKMEDLNKISLIDRADRYDHLGQYEAADRLMKSANIWDFMGKQHSKNLKLINEYAPEFSRLYADAPLYIKEQIDQAIERLNPMKRKIMDAYQGGSPVDRTSTYSVGQQGELMQGGKSDREYMGSMYNEVPTAGPFQAQLKALLGSFKAGFFNRLPRLEQRR